MEKLTGILGIITLLGIAYSLSNNRKEIKKVEFNLNYNFDQFTIKLDDIKIDDLINEDVNKNLNLLILKDNKLQNRIYLKSLMNQAIKNYAG